MQPNDIYNTNLRLIFYDEAIFGHYQQRFEAIFQDLRYTDLTANLRYFSALYTTILAQPHPPGATPIRAAILKRYDDAIGLEKRAVDQSLARLADLARHGT